MNKSVIPIGLWVLEQACAQAQAWDLADVPFANVAVNVSAVQLRDPEFADRVLEICRKTGWPATRLVLELTQSALMRDTESLRRNFDCFEKNGIHLSVDDFGTGFSNLMYLHRFPIQTLKIDRSFVSQMLQDLQVGALRNQGCDQVQGYHMTRPLLPAGMEAWIRARV